MKISEITETILNTSMNEDQLRKLLERNFVTREECKEFSLINFIPCTYITDEYLDNWLKQYREKK